MSSWNFSNEHGQTGVLTKSSTGTWTYVPNDGDNPDNEYITSTATTITWYQIGEYQNYARYTWPASHSSGDIVSSSGTAISGFTHNWGHTSLGGSVLTISQVQSGPTVTSITVANQNSTTRTFTVVHTGTLSASDITYTLDNGYNAPVDVQTLASPNTGVTNIQTTSNGSTFDSYLLHRNGLHSVTIDSTVLTFVVEGTVLQSTATNPIPSTTVITANDSSAHAITVYNRAANGEFLGYENSIGHHFNIRLKPNNKARLEVYIRNVTDTHFNDIAYSPLFTIGDQETMTFTYNPYGFDWGFSVLDWVYSAASEGEDEAGPVTTTSNGGGKPDRYPLIMTNLFNRNRSLYSIGMTHKDTWDLFL